MLVSGGTAAISQTVEADLAGLGVTVERVDGASRAETAIAIAEVGGAASAADTRRVIVTDGEGENAWAAGFALAAHAARFDVPIVLTTTAGLPPATERFLSSGVGGDPAAAPVITCAVTPSVCEPARISAGLPPTPSPSLLTQTLTVASGHTCGLAIEGAAYCWGNDFSGQLGDGPDDNADEPAPVPVAGGQTFTQITAGVSHTCGLASGGAAYCWGNDFNGQLGNGFDDGAGEPAPVPVAGGLTFAQLTAGGFHTCGLASGGTAYCWGNDSVGQLGDGLDGGGDKPAPVPVVGGLTFTQLTAGSEHTCGLATGGTAYCWGNDFRGRIGSGSDSGTVEIAPVPVAGGLTFTQLTAGSEHTCGLATGGTAYCWGDDTNGGLGNGPDADADAPGPVTGGLIFRT